MKNSHLDHDIAEMIHLEIQKTMVKSAYQLSVSTIKAHLTQNEMKIIHTAC